MVLFPVHGVQGAVPVAEKRPTGHGAAVETSSKTKHKTSRDASRSESERIASAAAVAHTATDAHAIQARVDQRPTGRPRGQGTLQFTHAASASVSSERGES